MGEESGQALDRDDSVAINHGRSNAREVIPVTTAEVIERKLRGALNPTAVRVIDESHRHEGHAGARPGGETHFQVIVTSAAFAGKSRVERQRMIYNILAQELQNGVHALSMTARTPDEK
jgi:BolA protein